MNILEHPSFVAGVRNYLVTSPPDFDSETTIARHITVSSNVTAQQLGLSDESLLSTDGFVWSYNATQGIWQRIELNQLITLAQLYDGIFTADDHGKPKRIKIGWQRAGNIGRSIHRLHELQAPKFFNNPAAGIPFTNGFCTVTEYGPELSEHDPDHAATVAYDFDLDTDAEPPEKWLAFLGSLWDGDDDKQSKISVLQEFLGASIANIVTTYQKCLLLIGTGSNGKSVLCDLVGELLFPEGTTTYVSPRRWDRDYSLASLKDSRINLVSELPETSVLEQTDVFKAVVAGDLIEARLPYQPPFYLRPSAGHVFSANEIPRTKDTSHGFFRRFVTLQFNQNFSESPFRKTKEEILASLEDERSAIIMWALHGAARLIRRGDYTEVRSHQDILNDWRKDSDAVFDFALTCLDYPSNLVTPLQSLRDQYQAWARRVGRCEDIAERTLSKRLIKIRGLEKKRVAKGVAFKCDVRPISDWGESVN